MRSNLVTEPYTNHLGQTINVGDSVMYVGTSYNITETHLGIFAGVYYRRGKASSVRITDVERRNRFHFIRDKHGNLEVKVGEPYHSPAILQLNRVFKLEKV